jgi:hypothetical protein
MIDILTILITVGIITVEIGVLVVLYRNYITTWNADKWLERTQQEGWMEQLLRPIIDVLVDECTDSIIQRMKMELLSGQGQISRQSFSDIETAEELAMKVSGELLKSTGIKNVPPMVQMKMAQGLGTLVSSLVPEKQQESALKVVQTGKELLTKRLF